MGVSAAAAGAAGFREPSTLWQVLCLALTACLTVGGTILISMPSMFGSTTTRKLK
jgi:hypothetical protein